MTISVKSFRFCTWSFRVHLNIECSNWLSHGVAFVALHAGPVDAGSTDKPAAEKCAYILPAGGAACIHRALGNIPVLENQSTHKDKPSK